MKKRCVIIGASPECDSDMISENVTDSDFIVCADGGYQYALQAGIQPNWIIGDFDSADFPEKIDCPTVALPRQKDDTDTMYCVKECIRMGYGEFLFLGMTGGRCDHTFANYCTLLYLAEKNITAKLIDRDNEIFIIASGMKQILNCFGRMFSIFPFGCADCTVTLKGFAYGLEQGKLTADFPLGVSNVIQSDHAEIQVHSGKAICILSKR